MRFTPRIITRYAKSMRCLIIDDDANDRELVQRIAVMAGHEAEGASGASSALERLRNGETFDVALVDLGMEGTDGVTAIGLLHKQAPDMRQIVVSGFDDRPHVLQAVAAGADGYVLKSDVPEKLAQALNDVVNGGGPMSAKIAHLVLEELRGGTPAVAPPETERALSRREWEVLEGLAKSYTYAEIAHTLEISVNTVRHHIRNLYGKLAVSGKEEAVLRAKSKNPPRG
jgi:DNA-binding NarL/FixJ family response regulator